MASDPTRFHVVGGDFAAELRKLKNVKGGANGGKQSSSDEQDEAHAFTPENIEAYYLPDELKALKKVKKIVNERGTGDTCVCLLEDEKQDGSVPGEETILKIISRRRMSEAAFMREAKMMRAASKTAFPHIARLYESYGVPNYYAIHMENCDWGDLRTFMCNNSSVVMRMRFFKHAVLGLQYIHGVNIIHCDIKPHNIGIVSGGDCGPTAKIIDFGGARMVPATARKRSSFGGTRGYTAHEANGHPEAEGAERFDMTDKMDIWSLAITLIATFNDRVVPPWYYPHETNDCYKRFRNELEWRTRWDVEPFLSLPGRRLPDFCNSMLIPNMLAEDPAARWSATQVLKCIEEYE